MKEFLRREWRNRKIPEQVYSQARNRAWNRMQSRRAGFPHWLLVPAGAALLLLWLTWPETSLPPSSRRPEVPLAQLPLESSRSLRFVDPLPPVAAPRPQVQEMAEAARPMPSVASPPLEQQRLVLNFVLPRSGVRVIWIKQNNPKVGEE